MQAAKKILTFTLMFVVCGAIYAWAQQAPTQAVKDIQSLAGKWTGWATPASGSAFPIEVHINPDGTYTSLMGAASGTGSFKVVDGKVMADGHLSGPKGAAAGTGMSQATIATKGDKQVLTGAGHNDAGPFNYELIKQ